MVGLKILLRTLDALLGGITFLAKSSMELMHVLFNLHLPEDIERFSAPDNFWCFQFQRDVERYVQQSSNNKHIEKSFARRESQRELMKFKQDLKLISSERCRFTWAKDKEKVIVVMN